MSLRPAPAESGVSAIVVVLMLVAIGGFISLAVNVGHLFLSRAQLRTAADSAALAGAASLDGEQLGLADARVKAFDFATRHKTDKLWVALEANVGNDPDGDIVLGSWSRATRLFEAIPLGKMMAQPRTVNAVRVKTIRERARGNAIDVVLSPFLGDEDTMQTGVASVAVRGGPCGACAIPLILAECQLVDDDGNPKCHETFVASNDTDDNMGFTNLEDLDHTVGVAQILDVMPGCKNIQWGAKPGVTNGNILANKQVRDALEEYIDQPVMVPVARFGDCPNPKFLMPPEGVVGFAMITIRKVEASGPVKRIVADLECEREVEGPPGCGNFGTIAIKPALVE